MLLYCFRITKETLKFLETLGVERFEIYSVAARGGSGNFRFDPADEGALLAVGDHLQNHHLGQFILSDAGEVGLQ